MWATTNPEIDPETGLRNQPAKSSAIGRALMSSDFNNFAPRVGLAYQVTRQYRCARGVAASYYNSTFVQELQDLRKFWPFTVQQVFAPNTGIRPELSDYRNGPRSATPPQSEAGRKIRRTGRRTRTNGTSRFSSNCWTIFRSRSATSVHSNQKQVGYTAINSRSPRSRTGSAEARYCRISGTSMADPTVSAPTTIPFRSRAKTLLERVSVQYELYVGRGDGRSVLASRVEIAEPLQYSRRLWARLDRPEPRLQSRVCV